ncbi:hypothetical protein ACHQM5_028442 [Ranunculus cassubicifolius]
MTWVDDEKPSPRPDFDSPKLYRFTASKKAKSDGEIDRISSLPVKLIHHIYSFMDMTEVVQTSILSNRWRYLWKSNPYLNFDSELMDMFFDSSEDDDYDNDEFFERKRYRFIEFLNKVFNRRNSIDIDNLRLKSDFSLEGKNLKKWLGSAVKGGLCIKNLYLNVSARFELDARVFSSELETLKLVGCEGYPDPSLGLPKAMCSADGIRKISLMYVKFPKGNADREITLSCPLLEDLKICECGFSHLESFSIRGPKVKKLELIGEEYPFCAVNICCPGLTSLDCRGYLNKAWSIENPSALVSADISFSKGEKVEKEVFSQYLCKALEGVRGVTSLTIPPSILQVITTSPEIMEILPNVFHRLRKIVVEEWFNNMDALSISSVTALLNRLPCLEAFTWKRMHYLSKKEKKALNEELQEESMFSTGLKTVEVKNFHGVEEEVKVVSFLLNSVVSLDKMIITPEARTKLGNVHEKLLALPRSSSCVLDINMPKKDDDDDDASEGDEEANEELESDEE